MQHTPFCLSARSTPCNWQGLSVFQRLVAVVATTTVILCLLSSARAQETIGGGTIANPAVGPAPSFGVGGSGFVLVKNWNFGTSGTIKNYADLSANFYYHDQFGTIGNGTNYGALTVSPDSANALSGQPIEGVNCPTVRQFTADSLKTLLVPLNGATTVAPTSHNAGCGSFMAKWKLPNGGSLLGQDVLWETRVRMVTPPYFWFAIWNSGNQWNNGAEIDLVESFGYDNGGGNTNYDGRFWHSNSVGGSDATSYANWANGMAAHGINTYDATQYHTWSLLYKKDNTYAMYVDGILVQSGNTPYYWTLGDVNGGTPVDMDFLFDAGWGHTQVASVNHSLAASALTGKYYEWDYSRVYLRDSSGTSGNTHAGTWAAKATFPGGTSWTHIQQVRSVSTNTNYVAKIWVKGNGKVSFNVVNSNWTANLASVAITPTSTWQQYILNFNSGSNSSVVFQVYDNQGNNAGAVTYFDDCFLGLSGGSNLLTNAGFESGNVNWDLNGIFSIVQNP